ncbi:DUF2271 domain-containing protein [Treponema sp. C6A8]|uniref:DUF2271 domain-containing protein n=1 Tax=Treponema sp. C6A8 TaxID=1410609 RepID=UPI0004802665|nr:DUF2271 domain-containing protein [Treponema sp. C6A8]
MKRFSLICLIFLGAISAFAREIKISVLPGQNWSSKHSPQFAIWLEDTEGNYIETLYVTEKASKKSWIFAPKEGRPESLPIWYHSSKKDFIKGQEKNAILPLDAVTGATPKTGIQLSKTIPDKPCIIKAEFNVSFDYNDTYTKSNSSVNGQPSVLYEAKISENADEEISLTYSGTGSVDGTDGKIYKTTPGLTTAISIIKSIILKVL